MEVAADHGYGTLYCFLQYWPRDWMGRTSPSDLLCVELDVKTLTHLSLYRRTY